MNCKSTTILFVLIVVGGSVYAQSGLVSQPITVSNNAGRSQLLTLGMDPSATNGIDIGLGEAQLPPSPPTGVFDARFVGDDLPGINLGQGSWVDYRQGSQSSTGTKDHEIKYQAGSGTSIKIKWTLPSHVSGRLYDIITGTLIDVSMAGTDSFIVTNPSAFPKLKLSIVYDWPLPIQLTDFGATVLNSTTVRIDWRTLSEINNYGFNVQRSSNPATDYTTITPAVIPGNGTTNIPHSYEYVHSTAAPGTWYYRLEQIDLDGTRHYSWGIEVHILTGIDEQNHPQEFMLAQNYPNPFNPSTQIGFTLKSHSFVELKVFDLLGRDVAVLISKEMRPGAHETTFEAGQLASGVYVYQLKAGSFIQTKRLMLTK